MISLGGIGTQVAVKLFDATRDKQLDLAASNALNARQIAAFEERIGSISSPQELIADTEVYTFVMRAFDLEDQIFGKAMIRKTLESDITDSSALVNRLSDPKIRDMYQTLGFTPGGGSSANLDKLDWQAEMIDRFKERFVLNAAGEDNEGARIALEFKSRASEINTWLDVLKDEDLGSFMRRALGVPDEAIGVDLDRQIALFEQKFDIEKLKDPAEVDKLVSRFSAIYDAVEGVSSSSSTVLSMMQGAVSIGQGSTFTAITIDIPTITGGYSASSAYR
ncbi:hypothetical protein A3753_02155 [Sulfitobacter sp. HI0082]|uniref:DUF1217 domain-containing protein n=1 Tax=uncultured Sulfitobacter sp. TaxID=191468 RepID=UPI0007D01A25|nr:hypothetical protein A3753_02155 [Sulfitobacter sp. HI0082]HAC51392.1 DUF1217 domain-containing protein [Sulfitobacter sp.]|tara:strand:+ start:1071 stop:1904 length:834 start_codon:yes stop_codon:yes gene_type:complete